MYCETMYISTTGTENKSKMRQRCLVRIVELLLLLLQVNLPGSHILYTIKDLCDVHAEVQCVRERHSLNTVHPQQT
jgi:hypothetical protein